jgi:hypothetical protein
MEIMLMNIEKIKPVRLGLTLAYIEEKLENAIDEFNSIPPTQKHEFYGNHDPFKIPVFPCDKCGKSPALRHTDEGKWEVKCPCGKLLAAPQCVPWQALLAWDSINLSSFKYDELPLFSLTGLSPDEAFIKMKEVRRFLEVKLKVIGLQRTFAQRTNQDSPGKGYQQKLEAYLQWSMLALRLIKVAAKKGKNNPEPK